MRFEVRLSDQALNFLKKNKNKEFNELIKKKLLTLSTNPFPKGVKKVKGEKNLFRIRVGMYRIIYKIYFSEGIIRVVLIDKRSRVYKRI